MIKSETNPDGIPAEVFEKTREDSETDYPKWVASISEFYFGPAVSPELRRWVAQLATQTSIVAVVECNRAFAETDFRPELAKVSVPTLVIHGDKDVFVPLELTGRKTAALIPGARLKVYAGAPHGLPLQYIDRLTNDLLSFASGAG